MEPVIIVAVVFGGLLGALVIGFPIGFFLGRRRKPAETPAVEPVVMEVPPAAPPPPPAPARNTPKDSVEVLSLWRNERTGKLIAMLETKPISPSHMSGDQKTKIQQILTSLHNMIGDPPPAPPPAPQPLPAPPPPAVMPVPVGVPVQQESLPPSEPESTSSLALLAEEPAPEGETGLPSPEGDAPEQPKKVYFADTLPEPVTIGQALLSNPFKITPPATSVKPAGAPKTIVEQIDEIFQAKLVGTPFEKQNIQLKESVNGMTIMIDSYKYEGIDAVPDPTVRALIKESAREWNEKVSRKR
ncbi:MAG TPA: hypothetical protein PK530_17075 [Anaerolineales bacterium]|nr:hypothetical protein [Anaerolineales bacterium]